MVYFFPAYWKIRKLDKKMQKNFSGKQRIVVVRKEKVEFMET